MQKTGNSATPSTAGGGGGDQYGKGQSNLLRVSTRSKDTETHVDAIRASYPLKLVSTKSSRVAPPLRLHPTLASTVSTPQEEDNDDNNNTTTIASTKCQRPVPPPTRIVYMIAYGGGLLKDDHPHLQIQLGPLSRVLILGQGSTKISKCPSKDYPPASQTIHATVGPGAVYLFLGPPVVACEDSSAFLKHEILLQAAPSPPLKTRDSLESDAGGDDDEYDSLPSCVALDWIAGGRGEEERWKARRIEWRMVVRWAELEHWPASSSNSSSSPTQENQGGNDNREQDFEDDLDDDYFGEEDPRDVADRLAGGPVIFRDGFLLEDDDSCPTPHRHPPPHRSNPASPSPQSSSPFSTSYAASIHPHSTIGTLFVMGPKTERLQRAIIRRFEKMTVFPGQKASVRPDYPILWSATSIQIPRPKPPSSLSNTSSASRSPRGKTNHNNTMSAVVVKMATQGVEQMQDFIKTLFEEQHLEDTSHFQDEQGSLSVIDELFGGRVVWSRALRS